MYNYNMNSNNNNDNWVREYIHEKMQENTKATSRQVIKPPTNYGIGFVQMNRTRNTLSKPPKGPPLKPLTLNALLKNSLRFENVMKRNKIRPTLSRTSSMNTDSLPNQV